MLISFYEFIKLLIKNYNYMIKLLKNINISFYLYKMFIDYNININNYDYWKKLLIVDFFNSKYLYNLRILLIPNTIKKSIYDDMGNRLINYLFLIKKDLANEDAEKIINCVFHIFKFFKFILNEQEQFNFLLRIYNKYIIAWPDMKQEYFKQLEINYSQANQLKAQILLKTI